jgi:hypothetical protein
LLPASTSEENGQALGRAPSLNLVGYHLLQLATE